MNYGSIIRVMMFFVDIMLSLVQHVKELMCPTVLCDCVICVIVVI